MLAPTLYLMPCIDLHKIIAKMEGHTHAQAASSDAPEKKAGVKVFPTPNSGTSFIHEQVIDGQPVVYIRLRLPCSRQPTDATAQHFTIFTTVTTRLFITHTYTRTVDDCHSCVQPSDCV
jgi:hypothetical protein